MFDFFKRIVFVGMFRKVCVRIYYNLGLVKLMISEFDIIEICVFVVWVVGIK